MDEMITRLRSVRTEASSTAEAVSKARAEVNEAVENMESETSKMEQLIRRQTSALDSAIEQFRAYLEQGSGPFKEEAALLTDLLDAGGIRLDEFIAKVGEWKVTTEAGVVEVRDLFEGLDLKGKEDEIRQFILELRTGTRDARDVTEILSNATGKWADELRRVIDLAVTGQVPLERLERIVGQIRDQLGDSAFADLADALLDALRGGRL